jgi:hypothetical protein
VQPLLEPSVFVFAFGMKWKGFIPKYITPDEKHV